MWVINIKRKKIDVHKYFKDFVSGSGYSADPKLDKKLTKISGSEQFLNMNIKPDQSIRIRIQNGDRILNALPVRSARMMTNQQRKRSIGTLIDFIFNSTTKTQQRSTKKSYKWALKTLNTKNLRFLCYNFRLKFREWKGHLC